MQQVVVWYDKAVSWLLAVMLAVLVAVGFAGVIFRYVLHSSLFWADEFLRYLGIWTVFVGAVVAMRHRALITVDIALELLPWRSKQYVMTAVYAVAALFLFTMVYFSLDLIRRSVGAVSASMGIPMEWMYLVFPIGLGLTGINALRQAARCLRAAAAGQPEESGSGVEGTISELGGRRE